MENIESKKKSDYSPKKNKYAQIHDNYKQLSIGLPIAGEITRDTIARAARNEDCSVNAYIIQAI